MKTLSCCTPRQSVLDGSEDFVVNLSAFTELTEREAAALLRTALREPRVRLHLPLFILIGLYTGSRKEAILTLRWLEARWSQAPLSTPSAANTGGSLSYRVEITSSAVLPGTTGRRRTPGP